MTKRRQGTWKVHTLMTQRTQLAGGERLVCLSLEGCTDEELHLLSYGGDGKFHLKGSSSV